MRNPLVNPAAGDVCAPASALTRVLGVDDTVVMVCDGGIKYWVTVSEWQQLMLGGAVVKKAEEINNENKS